MEDVLRDDYTRIGKAEGRAEGRAVGKAEGKAEEKQATVIRLLKKGASFSLIQVATELPIAAIHDISKSLKFPIASPTSD